MLLEQEKCMSQQIEDYAAKLGVEAYVYGYPLVLMDVTRETMTATTKAIDGKAPANQFVHLRSFPDYTFTEVVSPNADTLYSTAWLDLKSEPVILSVPPLGERYYLMPMLDGWTDVFSSPGTRTTGGGKGDFAITGPGWSGKLPAGVREIKAPTNMVWLIGRTQTNGKADYETVHAIQNQYRLTPLSSWGKNFAPPTHVAIGAGADTETPPAERVANMDTAAFFSRLNALMRDNPPATADAFALDRFTSIGVAPGAAFDMKRLHPSVAKGMEGAARAGHAAIAAAANKARGPNVNGWEVPPSNIGDYGTNYTLRAVVALVGLGANLQEDAIYPHATVDAQGQPLNGANNYIVHFRKGELPPVRAFWSLTMYNSKQTFVDNPIGRYAIGDRDPLKFNADGSLTIYIQRESPGKNKESNWLPAPADSFNICTRLYWPKEEVLYGVWKMPPVDRAEVAIQAAVQGAV